MKILFFGTASISKVYLECLYNNKHKLFVITMPDKPALRGHHVVSPVVKTFAIEKGIKFIQPMKFNQDVCEVIKSFDADVGVVVSYGKLIPRNIFDLPKFRTFNIHFSLLPKYRGAAPVQYVLLNEETKTGVTSFYIEDDLDTGNILVQKSVDIEEKDNAETLFNKLIPIGVDVMNQTLDLLKKGEVAASSQKGVPTFAPVFKKEAGLIDWSKSAKEIYNKLRGLYLWPGVYSIFNKGELQGKRIKILAFEVIDKESKNDNYGTVISIEKNIGFIVACGRGKILITKLQPENKSVMSAWSFVLGGKLKIGDNFNSINR
ncbi:MAG: methionyl-tRNA formyltransferase [Endomicrobium sp.]|uniref:methionyl-tRNA formyltransferase n=1 Tax=Candidatus Endomicrobiellum cubanum TaxID=3242325 RepID=UPI0028338041|nr:methionyl-tRNA formyltransferase [Endomicrobium sp.]